MSVGNVILQPGAGYLMSDAGVWGERGELRALVGKIATWPKLKAAMVCRGASRGMPTRLWYLATEGATTQPELFRGLEAAARRLRRDNETKFPGRDIDLELTVLVWDDRAGRPRAAQLCTADTSNPDSGSFIMLGNSYRPWTWTELPTLVLAPTLDWHAGLPDLAHLADPARFDVPACAAGIVTAQRAMGHELHGRVVATVAGWVDMAIVTADGLRVERVIEWPDQVEAGPGAGGPAN